MVVSFPSLLCVSLMVGNVEFVDGSCEEFDLIVCATGFYVAYPFLAQELQRVEGAVVKCYGGVFLDDYKGLYYIGWGQARGGVGSLIAAYGSFFLRCLKLQDEINVPLGLVFKQMGQQLPTTHLADPQKTFRQFRLLTPPLTRLSKKPIKLMPNIPTLVTAHSKSKKTWLPEPGYGSILASNFSISSQTSGF
jgi:hypothetical protein